MKWITVLRKRMGLSQGELANQIGIAQSHLSGLELGRFSPSRVRHEAIEKLENIFGLSASALLSEVTGVPRACRGLPVAAKNTKQQRPEGPKEARR